MSMKEILLADKEKFNSFAKIAFDNVDQKKSGLIDLKKCGPVMEKMVKDLGNTLSKEEIMAILSHATTDESGKIDFKVFAVLINDVFNAMIE